MVGDWHYNKYSNTHPKGESAESCLAQVYLESDYSDYLQQVLPTQTLKIYFLLLKVLGSSFKYLTKKQDRSFL